MSGIRVTLAPALALALMGLVFAAPVQASVEVGQKAPDFTLGSVDGKSDLKLSTTEGKATILVFWHSRCPHCTGELPVLQRVYTDLKGKGLVILGVSLDRDIREAAGYLNRNRITFPMAYGGTEAGYSVSDTYGVRGVPTIFVIDDKGIVRIVHVGEADMGTIKGDVERLGVK